MGRGALKTVGGNANLFPTDSGASGLSPKRKAHRIYRSVQHKTSPSPHSLAFPPSISIALSTNPREANTANAFEEFHV